MKTKRKEIVKKEEKKRSVEKKVIHEIEPRTFDVPGLSFTTRPRGTRKLVCRNFIIKTFEPY